MIDGQQHVAGLFQFYSWAVQYLIAQATARGLTNWRIVSGKRSFEEQAKLYAKGRSSSEVAKRVRKQGTGGTVTDAPPGTSAHNWGLAIDIEGADAPAVRELAKSIGFGTITWDPPHLEWPQWQSTFFPRGIPFG